MIGGILLLGIAIFGLMVLFGKAKTEQIFQLAVILIFAPILLAIGYNHILWLWWGLPFWMQILSILLIPFLLCATLKMFFPKSKWLQDLQIILFRTLIYAVAFPFRFLWRFGKFFLQRERPTQRLNANRPIVGARPPLENERRDNNQRNNIFD